jgi:RNA polymerase sigma-70 factor (ECF subfamily)
MRRSNLALKEDPTPPSVSRSRALATEAVEHYGKQLHGFLARRLHRPHEIEDLVQETFVALLKAPDLTGIANPRAYVLRVAANVLYRFSKREKLRNQRVEFDSELVEFATENPREGTLDELAERLSSQDQLHAALAKLPALFQAVLLMHYGYGYSYEEISAKLDISWHQVERYLLRAKRALMSVDWEWQ